MYDVHMFYFWHQLQLLKCPGWQAVQISTITENFQSKTFICAADNEEIKTQCKNKDKQNQDKKINNNPKLI